MTDMISSIRDLKAVPEGTSLPFKSFVLLHKVTTRTSKNGKEFLSVEVGDKYGRIHFNCFTDTQPFQLLSQVSLAQAQEPNILQIEGQTEFYQNKLSPRVSSIKVLSKEDAKEHLPNLFECSEESTDELWQALLSFTDLIQNPELKATVAQALTEQESLMKTCPGAISMHHAYRSGLLEHTVHATRLAINVLPLYPEINTDLVIAGILVHDIGKTLEYETQSGSTQKTIQGTLQGHIVLGYKMIRKVALQNKLNLHLLEHLEHILLSHQGQLEWGAPVLPSTPEAVFVYLVDNFDAKMGMVQYTLKTTPAGNVFSDFVPGLQTKLLTQK